MSQPLSQAEIDALKKYSMPTVSNAIEFFGVRKLTEGFMLPGIDCRFPELGVMVGYAATTTFRAWAPGTGAEVSLAAYYDHILSIPAPRILVAQDLDDLPVGALFGEVNSSVHQALGCVGHITNGGVRDLDECRAIGFHFFSGCVQVSHACVHYEDFGTPVRVGGITVHPGDLIHADQHGVCLVPREVAPRLAEACAAVEQAERPLIEAAQSGAATPAQLIAAREEVMRLLKEAAEQFKL